LTRGVADVADAYRTTALQQMKISRLWIH
jgi:hypothetical protein